MADEHDFSISRRAQLTTWIASQMLLGAGWAAAVVTGFGIFIAVLWYLGTWLPEESRATPDPNTWDFEDPGEP
jgi:hypothetical protein